jgi:hypothetical protein
VPSRTFVDFTLLPVLNHYWPHTVLMSDDIATWRRRQRALSLGACVWASVVGLLV